MRSPDGSVTTELVLLTPVLLVLLGFVVMSGRIGAVHGAVGHAAQRAARAATLVGTPSGAQTHAAATASANLDAAGISCRSTSIDVDTSRFEPGGDVTVTIRCAVDLQDIVFTGLPGQRTVEARAVEVIDHYRGTPP